jgi:uncharacterized membrane protein HdeD (DUF308 family)
MIRPTETGDATSTATQPRAAMGSVLLVAGLLVIGSLFWSSAAALSVALGSAVAVLHLWSVAHWVKRAFGAQTVRATWVVFSFLKLGLLLFGLAWLARNDAIDMLAFLIGYAALPLGISMAQLLGPVWLVLVPSSQSSGGEQSGKARG